VFEPPIELDTSNPGGSKQTTETTRRAYRTKSQKIQLLNELQSGGMTISTLTRKYGIHPVTIHKTIVTVNRTLVIVAICELMNEEKPPSESESII
jgi:hypothetical protein